MLAQEPAREALRAEGHQHPRRGHGQPQPDQGGDQHPAGPREPPWACQPDRRRRDASWGHPVGPGVVRGRGALRPDPAEAVLSGGGGENLLPPVVGGSGLHPQPRHHAQRLEAREHSALQQGQQHRRQDLRLRIGQDLAGLSQAAAQVALDLRLRLLPSPRGHQAGGVRPRDRHLGSGRHHVRAAQRLSSLLPQRAAQALPADRGAGPRLPRAGLEERVQGRLGLHPADAAGPRGRSHHRGPGPQPPLAPRHQRRQLQQLREPRHSDEDWQPDEPQLLPPRLSVRCRQLRRAADAQPAQRSTPFGARAQGQLQGAGQRRSAARRATAAGRPLRPPLLQGPALPQPAVLLRSQALVRRPICRSHGGLREGCRRARVCLEHTLSKLVEAVEA
mmetsp:Transcript_43806/g.88339  ORF Transcript_43806/g.88339 Transcript_43806/m.88339 type:complete len:390 (-) Transcript_43806:451-1620(-)